MWDLVSFAQGKLRRLCLEEMSSGPVKPSAITEKSGEHLPHVSRALGELVEKGLAECLTPNSSKNRFYQLTPLGKELLSKLQEIEGAKEC